MRPIEVPGRGTVHFPDGMTDEQIGAAIKGLSPGAPSSGMAGMPNQKEQAAAAFTQPEAITPPGGGGAPPGQGIFPGTRNSPQTRAGASAEIAARAAGAPPQPIPTEIDQPAAISRSVETLKDVAMTGATLAGGGYGAGALLAAPVKAGMQYLLPIVRYLPTGVIRVLLGAVGEETLSRIQGNAPEESLTGHGTVPVSLGVGAAVEGATELAKRKVPGVRTIAKAAETARQEKHYRRVTAGAEQAGRAQAAEVTADLGEQLHRISPRLAPGGRASTGTELSRLGIERGTRTKEEILGPYFADKLHEANMLLPTGHMIRVPAMKYEDQRWTDAIESLGLTGKPLRPHIERALEANIGVPRYVDRFSLDEVAEHMKQIGRRGYAGAASTPATRTSAGKPLREQYKEIMRNVQDDLQSVSPAAWEAFREGRHAYSVGLELTKVLASEKAWLREGSKATLDLAGLQNAVRKHADKLRDRMSPAEYTDLLRVVFQGGEVAGGGAVPLRTLVSARQAAQLPGAKIPQAVRDATPHKWGEVAIGRMAVESLILQGLSRAPILFAGSPGE